ncbi:MAG: ATP-binding protein, partial [Acidaminobacteraceae bacterium]
MFELENKQTKFEYQWDVYFIGDCERIYKNAIDQFKGEIYLGKNFDFKFYKNYDEFIGKIGMYGPPIIFLCDKCLESREMTFSAIDVIKRIREDIENQSTRIILVSDEGPVDVKDHILKYDINDIRKQEDLMGINLYTTIISSVRTYDGLIKLIDSEYELNKAKIRANESLKFKSRFLAKMSHEIRTPLNGMMITSQLLYESNLNEEQAEYVEIIKKSTNRLLPIINDIIDLSKIEYGKLKIQSKKMNLEDEIIDIVSNMKYHAKSKGLGLHYEIDSDVSRNLIGDHDRLRQVLINLLNNSIKFTEKGYIGLKCRLVGDKDTSQSIRFDVEDTGVGIHKDELENIFDVFNQTEVGCSSGGSGLGLSICKELIELMGGNIRVDSYHGIGSKFYFELEFEKNLQEIASKDNFTKIY